MSQRIGQAPRRLVAAGRVDQVPAAVDAATIQAAADAAVEETDPLSDLMGSAEYRKQMVRVWVRLLLTSLAVG